MALDLVFLRAQTSLDLPKDVLLNQLTMLPVVILDLLSSARRMIPTDTHTLTQK